jgi:multiple sugar transport system ATP-binding protein
MTELTATHLHKNFRTDGRQISAVRNVSLQLDQGEFLVLAGPTGSGKSTILRIIAGLETPCEGDVHIGEQCVIQRPARDRRVGMVFGDNALYAHITVSEILTLALQWRGYSKSEIQKRVSEAAGITGIEGLLPRRAGTLSWIEGRSVALARAIVHQPIVVLIEAPVLTVEPSVRTQLCERVSMLQQHLQLATIYATTDPVEAFSLGDRVILLNEGRVEATGSPLQLYRRPETLFSARFFGSPAMNLMQGTLRQGRDSLVFQENEPGNLEVDFGGSPSSRLGEFVSKAVVLGVRPEAIRTSEDGTHPAACVMFRAIVDLVEPAGGEFRLHLDTGAHKLLCLTRQSFDRQQAGTRLQLCVDRRDVHLFSPLTGERVAD